MCKVLKLEAMHVTWIAHSTPLRVGERFGNMNLLVSPLEYHVMILGLDFLKLSKVPPLIHKIHLVLLDKAIMTSTLLMMKRKLKMIPKISLITLVEGFNGSTNDP
jgi:hypothetical protein